MDTDSVCSHGGHLAALPWPTQVTHDRILPLGKSCFPLLGVTSWHHCLFASTCSWRQGCACSIQPRRLKPLKHSNPLLQGKTQRIFWRTASSISFFTLLVSRSFSFMQPDCAGLLSESSQRLWPPYSTRWTLSGSLGALHQAVPVLLNTSRSQQLTGPWAQDLMDWDSVAQPTGCGGLDSIARPRSLQLPLQQ